MRDCDSSAGGRDILQLAMERVREAVLDRRSPDVVAALLSDLARLCAEHFGMEERVRRRYGYGDAGARSAMHALLLEKIPDVQARICAGEAGTAGIVDFLHSLSEQAGYGPGVFPEVPRSDGSGRLLLVSY